MDADEHRFSRFLVVFLSKFYIKHSKLLRSEPSIYNHLIIAIVIILKKDKKEYDACIDGATTEATISNAVFFGFYLYLIDVI